MNKKFFLTVAISFSTGLSVMSLIKNQASERYGNSMADAAKACLSLSTKLSKEFDQFTVYNDELKNLEKNYSAEKTGSAKTEAAENLTFKIREFNSKR